MLRPIFSKLLPMLMINLSTPCMYKKNEELSCEAALHAMQGCKFF